MATWERIDARGDAHPLNDKQDKAAQQRFRALYGAIKQRAAGGSDEVDEAPDHLVVGSNRRDGTTVAFIGMARDLHGIGGDCTCCPREVAS